MFGVTIGLAGPKEAFQSIFLASRDYMDMKMGDALTDTVVDGDEGTFCPESLFDGTSQQLYVPEQWCDKFCRQVTECGDVWLGNEETMSWKDRTMVQKRQRDFILKHCVTR